mmetsp:Transcript_9838/g.33859  ORF Transcript_9838/g.33859 Transcript_9838/m.33859 type:complete len:287 (+) Transcript_9838:220-1080(+)
MRFAVASPCSGDRIRLNVPRGSASAHGGEPTPPATSGPPGGDGGVSTRGAGAAASSSGSSAAANMRVAADACRFGVPRGDATPSESGSTKGFAALGVARGVSRGGGGGVGVSSGSRSSSNVTLSPCPKSTMRLPRRLPLAVFGDSTGRLMGIVVFSSKRALTDMRRALAGDLVGAPLTLPTICTELRRRLGDFSGMPWSVPTMMTLGPLGFDGVRRYSTPVSRRDRVGVVGDDDGGDDDGGDGGASSAAASASSGSGTRRCGCLAKAEKTAKSAAQASYLRSCRGK